MRYHKHKYAIESSMDACHLHKLEGLTETLFGFGKLHIHAFYGATSYLNHSHRYSGLTGFPVKTANGHIHRMENILEPTLKHQHKYSGYTTEEVSYSSSYVPGKASY